MNAHEIYEKTNKNFFVDCASSYCCKHIFWILKIHLALRFIVWKYFRSVSEAKLEKMCSIPCKSDFLLLHLITKWQNCCKNWKHSKLHMRHSSGSVLLVCPFQFAMFSASQTVCKVLPLELFDPRDEKVGGTYLALLMLASCPH